MTDIQRRNALKGCLYVSAGLMFPFHGFAETRESANNPIQSEFRRLFMEALAHPEQLLATRRYREAGDDFETRAVAPRGKPSTRQIAQEAIDLIVAFEVTKRSVYQAKYQHPVWPQGDSGVTVGIGYDLGYVTDEWFKDDWKGYIRETDIDALSKATKVKGTEANHWIPQLRGVTIDWKQAITQFHQRVLPLYVGETLRGLPAAAAELSDKSLGALVSLVYNRGASFNRSGDRFDEMNNIRDAILAKEFKNIPDEIRKMKRLWDVKKLPGLHKRRDLEAVLFSEGLV